MLCGSAGCFAVMVLSRFLKCLVLGTALTLTQAAVRPAHAEIDLGAWENYATMAEQGAVCGAFADIMAMQVLVDEKLGRLWSERRNYSGSVIRRAAALEGRGDLADGDIDELLNRYSMWLLNNLANPANAEILSSDARDAAQDMVGDVCATLYAQADKAIVKKHPALASCAAGNAASASPDLAASPQQCNANEALLAAATVKKAETDLAAMMLRLSEEENRRRDFQQRNQTLEAEMAGLHARLDTLREGADAARDTAARAVQLGANNDQLVNEVELLQQEITSLSAVAAEKDTIAEQNRSLTAEIEQLAIDMAALQTQLEAERQTVSALPKPADLARARAETEAAKAETAQLSAELAQVKSELDDAVAAFDAAIGPASTTTALIETISPEASPVPASTSEMNVAAAAPVPDVSTTTTLAADETSPGLGLLDSEASVVLASAPTDIEVEATADEAVFVAQLGAFRSRTGAVSEIANLEQAFPDQLSQAGLNIAADRRADGKNMFRIMTAGMSADQAKQLCSVLWDRMVGCMVKLVP